MSQDGVILNSEKLWGLLSYELSSPFLLQAVVDGLGAIHEITRSSRGDPMEKRARPGADSERATGSKRLL